jgi:Cellulase (glycosyl hydrolase family 5)/Ricin-type beta-trefoil lectin domain-like
MESKGSFKKFVSIGTICALLLCSIVAFGVLRSTTAANAASSLNYHGVDRMGSEYRCLSSGTTTFDGPTDQTSINAMLTWKINIVRIPLNEDCWLGINGEPANGTSASQYRQDIVNYTNLLNSNGIKVILDLHWTAPGSQKATGQLPMPDADHAPSFWTSAASTFKNNSSVFFDLYNEPYTSSWSCWRNGSSSANASPCNDVNFAVAGMQTLVNTVRNTGATNVILLGGLAYANNLTGWLQNKPSDPDNNLAASLHIYNFNACNTTSCLDSQVAPVRAQYPVIAEEIGENDCAHGFIDSIMPWFDSHSIGYLGWTWSTYNCSSTPALISNYDGTPTNFGVGLKNHLLSLSGSGGGGGGTTPTPTSGHYYEIVNRNSGKALDISGASTANGGVVIQWPYSGGANQQWQEVSVNGGYKLINRNSGLLLDDPGWSKSTGVQLDQWSDGNGANQRWSLVSAGNGYYYIVNQNSGLYADVSGASTANGATVIQWSSDGGTNQQWSIIQVS